MQSFSNSNLIRNDKENLLSLQNDGDDVVNKVSVVLMVLMMMMSKMTKSVQMIICYIYTPQYTHQGKRAA